VLRSVIESLNAESSTDIALAAPITSRLVHLLKKPKKYELSMVSLFFHTHQKWLVSITCSLSDHYCPCTQFSRHLMAIVSVPMTTRRHSTGLISLSN